MPNVSGQHILLAGAGSGIAQQIATDLLAGGGTVTIGARGSPNRPHQVGVAA